MNLNIKTILMMVVCVGMAVAFDATLSYSAFAVKLKNGGTIYTETYWVEGNYIHIQFKSGTMKMKKDEIHSITEIKGKLPDEEETPTHPEPKTESRPGDKIDNAKTVAKPPAPVSEKEEIESYKKKKKEIQVRLEEAKKAHSEAKTKPEKEKAWKEMVSASKEMHQLQQEVIEKNNGTLPKWWDED
jgi:hypothetical protein